MPIVKSNHPLVRLILLASALLAGAAGAVAAELTRAAEIRALKGPPAESHNAVRLRGVVLLPPPSRGDSFVLSDESAAIYCEMLPKTRIALKRGDKVEVVGHSELGGFAPYVKVAEIRVEGTAGIPPATAVTFDQMASGSFDSQPVEVTGIVRRSEKPPTPEYASTAWMLELATGGGRLKVLFRDPLDGRQPVDAEIRVSGICFYQFSKSGQIHQSPARGARRRHHRGGPAPPAEVPLRQIDRLMSFASDGLFGHRVRVKGVVTYHLPGEGFWLEEDGQGLAGDSSRRTRFYSAGEAVEVTGFPVVGNYSPVLEDVTVKRLALGFTAPPSELKSTAEALDHDAALDPPGCHLDRADPCASRPASDFQDADGEFTAHLRTEDSAATTPAWETGFESACHRDLPGFQATGGDGSWNAHSRGFRTDPALTCRSENPPRPAMVECRADGLTCSPSPP